VDPRRRRESHSQVWGCVQAVHEKSAKREFRPRHHPTATTQKKRSSIKEDSEASNQKNKEVAGKACDRICGYWVTSPFVLGSNPSDSTKYTVGWAFIGVTRILVMDAMIGDGCGEGHRYL